MPRDEYSEPVSSSSYVSAINAVSVPFPVDQIPSVPRDEVMPRDADRVVKPAPVTANKFKPGAPAAAEMVSGHRGIFWAQYIKALQQYIDDLTADLGDDLYERMMLDSQVESCLRVLKVGVLAEEGRVRPAIEDEDDPRFNDAKKVADFVQRCLDQLPIPLTMTLYEMLDCFALGHKTAEVVYERITEGRDKGYWGWKQIKTKPRGATAFLVDAYINTIGIVATIPGLPYPIISGQIISDPSQLPNLLPRERFFVLTHNPKDGDPRGRSGLRAIYDPWWTKKQTWGLMLKYLAAFGEPSLWGTTAEGAQSIQTVDSAGNPVGNAVSPEQHMTDILVQLRGGSAAAFPFGSNLDTVPVNGAEHSIHVDTIKMCDQQMSKGILSQTLATEEGQHMARAASEVHMDVMEVGIRYFKVMASAGVRNDLFKVLVRYNFGDAVARELTPYYVLNDMNREDWARWSQVVSQLFTSGYIDEDQQKFIDKKLGLPARKKDQKSQPAIMEVEKARTELEMQAQQAAAATQQQAEAAQQQEQPGQVPTGAASPSHPNNQQQPQ